MPLPDRCPTCGKVRFPNRKEARSKAKKLDASGHMSTYRCGEYWHVGHIPWQVKKGVQARDEFTPRRPRREAG